jgi:RNA polymerase sigma-54 factor
MVEKENPQKRLSDAKIVDLLAAEGMVVARRTVAKYREALHIPPASQRKKLI